tara:strand:- start:355 stop:672 length:318 start_codon:yes stop_codon:yes gene_type:complete
MIWESNDEVAQVKDKYSLTILNAGCSLQDAQNKKLPTNSYLVTYLDMKKGSEHYEDHYDIVMGTKVNIFDCYHDKIGKRLKAIGYTGGSVNPSQFDTKAYLKTSK